MNSTQKYRLKTDVTQDGQFSTFIIDTILARQENVQTFRSPEDHSVIGTESGLAHSSKWFELKFRRAPVPGKNETMMVPDISGVLNKVPHQNQEVQACSNLSSASSPTWYNCSPCQNDNAELNVMDISGVVSVDRNVDPESIITTRNESVSMNDDSLFMTLHYELPGPTRLEHIDGEIATTVRGERETEKEYFNQNKLRGIQVSVQEHIVVPTEISPLIKSFEPHHPQKVSQPSLADFEEQRNVCGSKTKLDSGALPTNSTSNSSLVPKVAEHCPVNNQFLKQVTSKELKPILETLSLDTAGRSSKCKVIKTPRFVGDKKLRGRAVVIIKRLKM